MRSSAAVLRCEQGTAQRVMPPVNAIGAFYLAGERNARAAPSARRSVCPQLWGQLSQNASMAAVSGSPIDPPSGEGFSENPAATADERPAPISALAVSSEMFSTSRASSAVSRPSSEQGGTDA